MADLAHVWGEDIVLAASGDLLLSDGSEAARQRVLRRLLTNQNDYLWHLDYGAGLPRRVGETTLSANLDAVVRHQILLEEAVSWDPPPTVRVTPFFGGAVVHITYVDAVTGSQSTLGFRVEP